MIESMFYALITDERKELERCLYTHIIKFDDLITDCKSIRFQYTRGYYGASTPYDEFSEGKFRVKFRNKPYYLDKFIQEKFGVSKDDDRK